MKANHRSNCFPCLIVPILWLLGGVVQADTIFVSCYGSITIDSKIMSYDSAGSGTVFANFSSRSMNLSLDSQGSLYAINGMPTSVYTFDSAGNATVFASGGLMNPRGMAFDSVGNLYVVNYSIGSIIDLETGKQTIVQDGWISKFSPDGISLGLFASDLISPAGLVCDSSDNLYTTDSGSILKFSSTGNKTVFAADVRNTVGLAFDHSGNLYAGGGLAGTITKFQPDGSRSVFVSGLINPAGIAFGSGGDLYVADYGGGTVMKYDANGVGSVFASGLDRPYGIAVLVPEPMSLMLLAFGALLVSRRKA